MAPNPQSQAIVTANDIMALAQQVMNLYRTIVDLDAVWTDDQVANIIAKFGTAPVQPDGSLGTADATPNTSNPIIALNYPPLARDVSSLQLNQAKTILDGIVAYVDGQAVTANPGARAILNAVIGG